MIDAIGYAAADAESPLRPTRFTCNDPTASDVLIEVMFCGICHSDIHQVRNEWQNTVYPCMPGHEVVGRVTRVGEAVTKFKPGDIVGVGCMIDSCRRCAPCRAGEQNYCEGPNSWLATYNGPMVPGRMAPSKENMYGRDNTYGGYSTAIVVTEDFVLRIPEGLDPAAAAPILCAGVTTFSPMRHFGVKSGDRVGILGFGGLGDMAAKLAIALGAKVTIFSTSPEKAADATRLGATLTDTSDEAAMKSLAGSFDFILSTIPTRHALDPFIALLKHDATIVVVGALEEMAPMNTMPVAFKRRRVAGSLIGSIAETQAVLDFCAEHRIAPDIQVIGMEAVNEAYEKVVNEKVRFRYVIDAATIKQAA